AAVVGDVRSGFGDTIDVSFVQPDAVAESHARAEQVEAIDVFERGAAATAVGVFLLVGGLHQVHVQRGVVLFRCVGEQGQRVVGAPVQVGWRQLDFYPFLVVVFCVQRREQ